ncbi:MAG: hypothetical protein IMZ71_01090 [Chloroflexi bacterium]|nr:hypothetical protein [Chloroflexota bacterium]
MSLIRGPALGLSSQVPSTALEFRNAAKYSENLVYELGRARFPFGMSKLDMTTGLNSGDTILAMWQWSETDRTSHVMAHTKEKIYEHDRVNETWADRTQSGLTMASNVLNPVSYAEVGHNDTDIYLDDIVTNPLAYFHCVTSDGGLTNVQRWAGKYESDFANLLGGGDYHDGTTHRCLQVTLSQHNRLLLISPKEYNSTSKVWIDNPQRVRWPVIGKIETWTGTGSGYVDLFDTGGVNLWSARLGSSHIIYQTKGIWTFNYVAGTKIFDPRPFIPDLGLQAAHLLVNHNDVHYFMGTDLNIYAYAGGTVLKAVGDPIHQYLIDDLDPDYSHLCWMMMGYKAKFLWVGIVEKGKIWPTKVYRMNTNTGAWHIRDFSSRFTSGGLTAATLAPATSYITGDTYAEALAQVSLYDQSDAGDATVRYGDFLMDSSRALSADYTVGIWSAGGFDYSKVGENFHNDFTDNDMMVVFDGSNATNVRYGHHFYTVYDVSANGFSVYGAQDVSTQGEHGIADSSTTVPADLSVDGKDTIGFYSLCSYDVPGETYNMDLKQINVQETVMLGDSAGLAYQYDETNTNDDGSLIAARHITPVIDGGTPGAYKRWGGWGGVCDGSVGGAMTLSYRTSGFDTSANGWVDFTVELTSEAKEVIIYPNVTSRKIQLMLSDFSGKSFAINELFLDDPVTIGGRR